MGGFLGFRNIAESFSHMLAALRHTSPGYHRSPAEQRCTMEFCSGMVVRCRHRILLHLPRVTGYRNMVEAFGSTAAVGRITTERCRHAAMQPGHMPWEDFHIMDAGCCMVLAPSGMAEGLRCMVYAHWRKAGGLRGTPFAYGYTLMPNWDNVVSFSDTVAQCGSTLKT